MKKEAKPILIRMSSIAAVVFLILAVGAAAFVGGYAFAFSKTARLYASTEYLKIRAMELEEQIFQLRNYAVLIDALAVHGQAANELLNLPRHSPDYVPNESDTGRCEDPPPDWRTYGTNTD